MLRLVIIPRIKQKKILGPIVSNCGARPPTQTWKYCKDFKTFGFEYLRIIVNASWYVTNDTLHHDFNVSLEITLEIKILGQRYADRMEEHPNILATNLTEKVETTGRLKRRLPQDLCTQSDDL